MTSPDRVGVQRAVLRRWCAAALVSVTLLAGACSSDPGATIVADEPAIDTDAPAEPVAVSNTPAAMATTSAEEPSPDPSPIAAAITPESTDAGIGPATSAAGLTTWAIEGFTVGVPREWLVFTSAEDVQTALEQGATAVGMDEATAASFMNVLAGNDALLARDVQSGDNVSVIPTVGGISPVANPDAYIQNVESALTQLPLNGLRVESVATSYGGSDGVFTRGAYSAAGRGYNLFQFSTESNSTVYTVTVTLLSGPDLTLAESIFSSFAPDT